MGLCSSAEAADDRGFDWWYLVKQKKWDALLHLIEIKSETCLQESPATGNLLLHELCAATSAVPMSIYHLVITAHKEVLLTPNQNGQLPLFIACGNRGPTAQVNQLVQTLIENEPKACKIAVGLPEANDYLPLHQLLCNSRNGLNVDLLGSLLLENYPEAAKEQRQGEYPLQLGLRYNAPDQFMIMVLDLCRAAAREPLQQHCTMVHWACQRAKVEELTLKLIKVYPEACQMTDSRGNLPLHVAVELGDKSSLRVIETLIHTFRGGLLKIDSDGNTPLHSACEHLHVHVSHLAGLMIDLEPQAVKMKDRDGNLPIHSMCEQSNPATDVIHTLIDIFPASLQEKDRDGNLPVHSAIERGDVIPMSVIEKMIALYPESVTIKDKEKNTPLHSATECRVKDLAKIVHILLTADVNGVAVKSRDKEGNLPIHSACEFRTPSSEVILMLCDAYPDGLKVKDKDGNLPLHSAIENRGGSRGTKITKLVIQSMLEKFPGATKIMDKDSNLPIHCAFNCCTDQRLFDFVKLLLKVDPSSSLVKSRGKGLLLHYAIASQTKTSLPLIQLFCNAAPKCLQLKDTQGNLPIHIECEKRNPSTKVILMLLDTFPGCLKVKDRDGNLPIHSAIEKGDIIPMSIIEKMVAIFPESVTIKDKEKNTPLHSATECRVKDLAKIVHILLTADVNGVAVKSRDKEGNLPIHSACEFRTPSSEVILMLCDTYPDGLKVKDRDGNLPLHSAIEKGDVIPMSVIDKMVAIFPESVTIKDKEKNTPLHSAIGCRTTSLPQIVQILLSADVNGVAVKSRDQRRNLPIHKLLFGRFPYASVGTKNGRKIKNSVVGKKALSMLIHATKPANLMLDAKCNILQYGIDNSDLDVVKDILTVYPEAAKQHVRYQNKKEIPLHYACGKLNLTLGILQELIKANANSLSIKDSRGKLPLRILHELPAKKNLIQCAQQAYPEAYDEMFGSDSKNPLRK